jgi:hypothetical protein
LLAEHNAPRTSKLARADKVTSVFPGLDVHDMDRVFASVSDQHMTWCPGSGECNLPGIHVIDTTPQAQGWCGLERKGTVFVIINVITLKKCKPSTTVIVSCNRYHRHHAFTKMKHYEQSLFKRDRGT